MSILPTIILHFGCFLLVSSSGSWISVTGFQKPSSMPVLRPRYSEHCHHNTRFILLCKEQKGGSSSSSSSNENETHNLGTTKINDESKLLQRPQQKTEKKSWDEMLDQQFFDPSKVTENDSLPVRWFAKLVKNDYNVAETIFAGTFIFVLVVVSQELLRMQLYGMDGYVPFQGGVRPGQLF